MTGRPYLATWAVSPAVTMNGIARVATVFADALDAAGLACTRAAMGPLRGESDLALPSRQFWWRLATRERELFDAAEQWARRFGSGTVHSHDPLQAAVLWRRLSHPRIHRVYTVHSLVADETRARGLPRGSKWVTADILGRAERIAIEEADRIHCLSTHVADLVRAAYPGVDPTVIPYGLPAVPIPNERSAQGAHAVCVRRLEPRTGVDLAVRAWASAPDLPRLVVVGTGSLADAIRHEVRRSSLRERVALEGRVTDARLNELYRTALVNVMPTRSMEGFGLPILEAAAHGIPTAGFGVGAVEEVVASLGQSPKFVARPGDVADLARAVSHAAAWAPKARDALAERVRHEWTISARLPAILELVTP